ncbi:Uncharacterised protein [uncultured Clostridium sp.]|nr:Uncharacterised protein [uncultured Clostridium sp.]
MFLTNGQKVIIVLYFVAWLFYPKLLFAILLIAVIIKLLLG